MGNGSCTVCPKACQWDKHVNSPWWFDATEKEEERSYHELKQRYDHEAYANMSRVQVMVANIEAEIVHTYEMTRCMIDRAQRILQRLDEIALRPNPLSVVEYIDLLIQSEQDQTKKGFLKRIKYLREIREQTMHMKHVQDMAKWHTEAEGNVSRMPNPKVNFTFANIWSRAVS